MRLSSGFIPTVKETPAEAVIPSHQLMIRSGMVRPLGAGIYSFLPLGYRVMKKAMEIVRQEMDAIGGQELHLPALSPLELWESTGRVKAFGDILFHVKNRPLVLAPPTRRSSAGLRRTMCPPTRRCRRSGIRSRRNSGTNRARVRASCAAASSS